MENAAKARMEAESKRLEAEKKPMLSKLGNMGSVLNFFGFGGKK
jgi:hypothetical protein